MAGLVKFQPSLLSGFISELKIRDDDDVKLRIKGGVVTAHVKKADGSVRSATTMLSGRFQQMSTFSPDGMTPIERKKVVKKLRRDGHRQVAIADLLGVSQATVSLDLKKR